jgi:hypothetical protein
MFSQYSIASLLQLVVAKSRLDVTKRDISQLVLIEYAHEKAPSVWVQRAGVG